MDVALVALLMLHALLGACCLTLVPTTWIGQVGLSKLSLTFIVFELDHGH